jgi:hypothetical protein
MLRLISQRFFTSSKRDGWKRWIHERSSQRYQRFFTSSKRACSKRQIHTSDDRRLERWIHERSSQRYQRFFTSSKRACSKRQIHTSDDRRLECWIHERSSQRYQRFFTSSKRASWKRQIHDGSFGKDWIHKDERSNVFGQYAGEYDEHRPNYPSEVFDEILRRRGETNLRVIDVATGTGRGAFA